MITIEQFENLIGTKSFLKDGKPCFNHTLNLNGRKDITELPDNITVLGGLDLSGSGVKRLSKGLNVMWWLNISQTDIEELPEDTKFYGNLYVEGMNKPFSFPKVVDVKSNFYCRATTVKRMPKKLYVKNTCDLSKSTFDKLPLVTEVGYSLYLVNTSITELPESVKEVFGNLDISNTKISSLRNNLVVYKEFIAHNTEIKQLPEGFITGKPLFKKHRFNNCTDMRKKCSEFSLFRGCNLGQYKSEDYNIVVSYTSDIVYFEPNYKGAFLFENENGKYIKANEIFGKLIYQDDNIHHIKRDKSGKITYLVTDGKGIWTHSYILEVAKADLIYEITKRSEDFYKDLTLESVLSFQDAILCFMIITGACLFRNKDYIGELLSENKKDSYTIKEIIELTKDAHGNEYFQKFFL
jgi:hypothetical protein|nr:MAG TPA: SspH2 (Leucine-rich repeat protein) [Caudoviricetes sp.]